MTQRLAAVCATMLLAAPVFGQMPAPLPAQPCATCNNEPAPAPASCCAFDGPTTATMPNFWLSSEYLLAWIPGEHLPALVTTSPTGTARAQAGVIGQPGTSVLFGSQPVNGDVRSGLRFQTGYWFDDTHSFGIEAGTMLLESQATLAGFASSGSPILARPIFNVLTQAQDSVLVAFPGVASGAVSAQVHSGNFYEAHIDLAQNMVDKKWFRLDTLFGYRFFRFDEGLGIQQVSFPTGSGIVTGTNIAVSDSFGTHNEFNGGDFGVRARFVQGTLSADVTTRLAVGMLDRQVNINGQTTLTVPGSPSVTQTGGLLALTSNINGYRPHYATLLPEFDLGLAWQVLPYLKLRLNYSLLLLDRVARAADQVRLAVNPSLFPTSAIPFTGAARPEFNLRTADLWMQSIGLGAEFTF